MTATIGQVGRVRVELVEYAGVDPMVNPELSDRGIARRFGVDARRVAKIRAAVQADLAAGGGRGDRLVCVLCGDLFEQKEGQYVSKAQRAAGRGLCESCYEIGPADLRRPFPRAVRTGPLPEAGR